MHLQRINTQLLIRLVLTALLVLQPLGHGVLHAGTANEPTEIVICTSDGLKLVSTAASDNPAPHDNQTHQCPCGVVCSACSVAAPPKALSANFALMELGAQLKPDSSDAFSMPARNRKVRPRAPPTPSV